MGNSISTTTGKHLFTAEINDAYMRLYGEPIEKLAIEWGIKNGYSLENVSIPRSNLSYINFSKTNLSKANLIEANLSYTNLSYVNLLDANLIEANLSKANLSNANLAGANLSEANLSGARLFNANLINANLSCAILTDIEHKISLDVKHDLLQRIYNAAKKDGALNMENWHKNGYCGATHCHAGHTVVQYGLRGNMLESLLGTNVAAALILHAHGVDQVPNWFDTKENALELMKKHADMEQARS